MMMMAMVVVVVLVVVLVVRWLHVAHTLHSSTRMHMQLVLNTTTHPGRLTKRGTQSVLVSMYEI